MMMTIVDNASSTYPPVAETPSGRPFPFETHLPNAAPGSIIPMELVFFRWNS